MAVVASFDRQEMSRSPGQWRRGAAGDVGVVRVALGLLEADALNRFPPREMVEGTAEVVSDLTNDDREAWRGWCREVDVDAVPRRVCPVIYPAGPGIRFDVDAPLLCETFQYLLGPVGVCVAPLDGGLIHGDGESTPPAQPHGSGSGQPSRGEEREVSVKPHAQRRDSPFVLEPPKRPLDRPTVAIEALESQDLTRDERCRRSALIHADAGWCPRPVPTRSVARTEPAGAQSPPRELNRGLQAPDRRALTHIPAGRPP